MSNTYQDLMVWKKAVELSVQVYKLTESFPKSELFGLTSQIRRAVVAVASNIAEGQGRGTKKEFAQFLKIAFASLLELKTQLIICQKIGYLIGSQLKEMLSLSLEIKKMIYSLEKSLKTRNFETLKLRN